MKTKTYFYILLRVVSFGLIGMTWSFINPHLHDFFGDLKRLKPDRHHIIDEWWDWSQAHYWFHWMMLVIMFLTLYKQMSSICKMLEREQNDK